jgi:hypothetical protein
MIENTEFNIIKRILTFPFLRKPEQVSPMRGFMIRNMTRMSLSSFDIYIPVGNSKIKNCNATAAIRVKRGDKMVKKISVYLSVITSSLDPL